MALHIHNHNSDSDNHVPILDEQLVVRPGEVLKILFINQELWLARVSQEHLQLTGSISVTVAVTGNEALTFLGTQQFDAVVSDYDMPDMNGIDLHRSIQEKGIKIPFILFTVPDEIKTKKNDEFHPHDLLKIPDSIFVELSQKIVQAVELHRTRNRLELYSRHLEELVEERTRQLREAQRFAVIGELSTMIGHDMRNPLQVITNTNYLLSRKVKQMDPAELSVLEKYAIPDLFARIGVEAQYLNKIVSDLQSYAREINPKKTLVDPGKFLLELLKSISLPDQVHIQTVFQEGLAVLVDDTLFRRVLENLIINAIQAMESGGTLTLRTAYKNDYISILVSDTGSGIPVQAQDRIFEPLFTTKSKGTGFGLAVCKRLVEAHGGTISLKETSAAGTTFEVLLPPSGI
jgi:signal transduction histidine kinase